MFSPMAEAFTSRGHAVVIPNYSIYPKGHVGTMVEDIEGAVRWLGEGGAQALHERMVCTA